MGGDHLGKLDTGVRILLNCILEKIVRRCKIY